MSRTARTARTARTDRTDHTDHTDRTVHATRLAALASSARAATRAAMAAGAVTVTALTGLAATATTATADTTARSAEPGAHGNVAVDSGFWTTEVKLNRRETKLVSQKLGYLAALAPMVPEAGVILAMGLAAFNEYADNVNAAGRCLKFVVYNQVRLPPTMTKLVRPGSYDGGYCR